MTVWYRRVCEVAIMVGLLIGGLWLFGMVNDNALVQALRPSSLSALVGLVSIVVGVVGLVWSQHRWSSWVSVAAVVAMNTAALLAMLAADALHSPYVTLWMLSAVFAAIFGLRSLLPVLALIAAGSTYLVLRGELAGYEWLLFGFIGIVPLVASYIIWGLRLRSSNEDSNEVSVLAAELNQESSKSNIIVNAIADGVMVVDEKGTIQLINPAALSIVGWGKDDALRLDYRSVLKIIDVKDTLVTEQNDPIQQCLLTKEPVITDKFGIRTVSGKKLLTSIMVSPLGGAGHGAVVVFRDITSARAEEREQAEFISTASHEMRTPVAAIEGYLGLALNPQTAVIDDKARMYLMKAHESSQHLGRLFQDLLDISRIEDGRLQTSEVIIDTTERCREIINDFVTLANEKGLSLVFEPDNTSSSKLLPIFYTKVDVDQFREIFGNLVENAIKYTREGTVSVDVKGTDERVFVSIQDSGIGIPAEDIPHLFQKFYRVDNTDTREIGGTGLGLYLSRRLTENMGGQLSVDSEYGKGSVFTIELPRIDKGTADHELAKNQTAGQTPAPQITGVAPTPPVATPTTNEPASTPAQPSQSGQPATQAGENQVKQ